MTPDGQFNVNISHLIDHTLLKPDATVQDVVNLCMEAKKYNFASVCINPCFVKTAAEVLSGTNVKVCTVIGFPLGATTKEAKAFEAKQAIENGAEEVDMVINIGFLKSKKYNDVLEDIKAVRGVSKGKVLKVIIETCYLTEAEKIKACELSKEAGADYVKTSTGFGKGGATVEDILLMRKVVGRDLGVKASGGIRDFEKALEMVKAGATRIGASASVKIVNKEKSDSKGY
ncbi:deoxyribose-phosphate aldolase [Thermotomaculum hydrothermale]|uniref:deoxyribose-phosphate aldolase n=1 Tax=Thermotomaculum hydrothermale TaxID=981385 RepID=UPI0038B477AF